MNLSPKKVLVIEDDESVRFVISKVVIGAGHQVTEAVNGKEGLSLLDNSTFDLIITDLMMPELGGEDLILEYRKRELELFTPILVLTSINDKDVLVRLLENGADDYITKPFNAKEFKARLNVLLRICSLTRMLNKQSEDLRDSKNEILSLQAQLLQKERLKVRDSYQATAFDSLVQPIATIKMILGIIERENSIARISSLKEEVNRLEKAMDSLTKINIDKESTYSEDIKMYSKDKD